MKPVLINMKAFALVFILIIFSINLYAQVFIESTWLNGSDTINQNGIYGTKGTANQLNIPGSRGYSVKWQCKDTFWLFGGFGTPGSGSSNGQLNDLWYYDKASGMWIWVSGTELTNQNGNYGTKGTGSSSNLPGGRNHVAGWVSKDTLWMFGGFGYPSGGTTSGTLNDLWCFDTKSGEWTWISGSNDIYQNGVYGTKGIGSSSNTPGARETQISWISRDTLWLFGGYGRSGSGNSNGYLNDLWCFDKSTKEWTWVSGSDSRNQNGIYGTKGIGDSANMPGSRRGASSWVSGDTFWLFGGSGFAATGSIGLLNDLWYYVKSTGLWTWAGGSDSLNINGKYGNRGVGNVNNIPGARRSSVFWAERDTFWLFGGAGRHASGSSEGHLNDLWCYDKASGEWTWLNGTDSLNQNGKYGKKGKGTTLNSPGARDYSVSWHSNDTFWIFGGSGYPASGAGGFLNDLWYFNKTCASLPLGDTFQSLCPGSTLTDINISGMEIKWYANETGGSPLTSSTGLNSNTSYFATQTINGCESPKRLQVDVEIKNTDPPTGDSMQSFCKNAEINEIAVNGTVLKWYDAPDSGSLINSNLILSDGSSYYCSQTINGCESNSRLKVTVDIFPETVSPDGDSIQEFCNSGTIADLVVTGSNIQWYADATGGTPLSSGTALYTGISYFASQTNNTCESEVRFKVTVIFNPPPAPLGDTRQTFCNAATVSDLEATGLNIQWYDAASGGILLSSATKLFDGATVFASQTIDACESESRLEVKVIIHVPPAPSGPARQNFCRSASISDLNPGGSEIKWYKDISGGSPLNKSEALKHEIWYYASQTIDGCESENRLEIMVLIHTVDVSLSQTGLVITANTPGASYQWLDCDNNFNRLSGETGQSFTAKSIGKYAVEITQNNCKDTSICVPVTNVSIEKIQTYAFNIYPNPATSEINIICEHEHIGSGYQVRDITGKILMTGKLDSSKTILHFAHLPEGIYLIKIGNNDNQYFKIVKE